MKKNRRLVFFPILINLKKFPCMVVGGGKVAYRKILALLEFNTKITIVSPRLCRPLIELAAKNKIKIIKKSYSKEYLKNIKIVFCTTDNEKINKAVYNDCTANGILINVADKPSLCDFILPANLKRGDLTISVSSQGKAPFYAKEIKNKLDDLIPPVYADIIRLAGQFRSHLLTNLNNTGDAGLKKRSAKVKAKMFNRFSKTNWEEVIAGNDGRPSSYYIQKILKGNYKS